MPKDMPMSPQLLAPLQIPNLHNLVAGSGGGGPKNLQDVIKDFLWAKQQASATANVMSNLRSLMEAGTGQVSNPHSLVEVSSPRSLDEVSSLHRHSLMVSSLHRHSLMVSSLQVHNTRSKGGQ